MISRVNQEDNKYYIDISKKNMISRVQSGR